MILALSCKPRGKRLSMFGVSHDIFTYRVLIHRLEMKAEMRSTDGAGRFGGGWNWILGFEFSFPTLILNLLIFSVRIHWIRKRKDALISALRIKNYRIREPWRKHSMIEIEKPPPNEYANIH